MLTFAPQGYVSISQIEPLIICKNSQEYLVTKFKETFPQLWLEVLMKAHATVARNKRFCSVAFLSQSKSQSSKPPVEIHCSGYEFSPEMDFEFHSNNVQPTFTDDSNTVENVHIIVITH